MTIRLATATSGNTSVIARTLCIPLFRRGANDNGASEDDDRMLWEALRHFAGHGLHAAKEAAAHAEAALEAGDAKEFEWWQSICVKLDRGLGARLAQLAAKSA